MATEFDFRIVADPTVFKENVLPAHSDHIAYASRSEAERGETSYRKSLNGLWKFSYAKNPTSAIPAFWEKDYDVTGWDDIRVPSNIQFEGYDAPAYVNTQYPWDGREDIDLGQIPMIYNPTASYVTWFDVPENWDRDAVYISFQGADSGMALWLNGHYVGYSEDSFTPHEFDLSPYITEDGRENRLAVRVYKWTASSWLEDQDMYRLSGLFRDVYLFTTPTVHAYDVRVRATLDDAYTDGTLEIAINYKKNGKDALPVPGETEYTLTDASGNVVVSAARTNKPDLKVRADVPAPEQWSAEVPYLYRLEIVVKDADNHVLEVIEQNVGFRRFEMKDGIMCLNGKRIVFRGVNRHEFSCDTGHTPAVEEVLSDILTMKRNNINAVRTCHYPDASIIYDLCDQYGLYMIAENNMEAHGYWDRVMRGIVPLSKALPGDRKEYLPMMLDRVNSTYQRDKNHPAILIWSCGNESLGGKVPYEMSQFFRKHDPDRLVHYEGVAHDRRYEATTDMETQMYTPAADVEQFIHEHPGKPFILCEYTHSMGNSLGAMFKYIDLADREPRYQGGFIWDFVDQSVRMKNRYGEEFQGYGGDNGERPTDYDFSGNGIVDGTRRPYAKILEAKACYQPFKITVDGNKVTIRNRNLFVSSASYDCVVTLEKDGEFYDETLMDTNVAPLSEETYRLPIYKGKEPGEYVVTVAFVLSDYTDWADQGYEVAFGQGITLVRGKAAQAADTPFEVIRGVHNIGVRGRNWDILLSMAKGGIVSYRWGGKEMIEWIPRPNFWRAPTSNDLGNRAPGRIGMWRLASDYQDHRDPHGNLYGATEEDARYPIVKKSRDHVDVTWKRWLPTVPMSTMLVTYRIFADGRVRVITDCTPAEGLPPMPEFGFMFKLNADYDHILYYGMGPEENYCDRKHGARLGLYETTVDQVMEHYLVPQETGNRTGVRWARVTDRRGRGMEFRAVTGSIGDDPNASAPGTMEFSALPYTPAQLEEAMHPYELPRPFYTVVRCSLKQMGVGGDDSWGAPVHEEFQVKSDRTLHFEFEFVGL